MKIVLKPLIAATAVSAMLAADVVTAKDGCGEEEETTKVVEEDTATSQGSEEPLPVLASNPELPKDRALVKPSVEVSTNTSEAIAKTFTIPDLSMEMLWVKPGTFEMGSPSPEKDRRDDETPHAVTLTQGFYLGKHEVTQAQWEKVMGSNPSGFKGGDRPVEQVSWNDAVAFCKKLTDAERRAGRLPAGMAYQLPTEAQWEYACRAGTRSVYSFGENLTSRQANIIGGPKETTSVGKYPANPWGFHDMHGNVWEWCADWYGDFLSGDAVRDPVGPADGSYRVERGGSWIALAHGARCANRRRHGPAFSFRNLGFRLSLRPPASK